MSDAEVTQKKPEENATKIAKLNKILKLLWSLCDNTLQGRIQGYIYYVIVPKVPGHQVSAPLCGPKYRLRAQ